MKYLFLVPFAIALTLEFFQQELIKGGLSLQTFTIVNNSAYFIAAVLIAFSAQKSSSTKNNKLILYILALITGIFSIINIFKVL